MARKKLTQPNPESATPEVVVQAPVKKVRRVRTWHLALVGVLLLLLAPGIAFAGRFGPRSMVAGVSLTGLTQNEAETKVAGRVNALIAKQRTFAASDGVSWQTTIAETGYQVDWEAPLRAEFAKQQGGTWWQRFAAPYRTLALGAGISAAIVPPADRAVLEEAVLNRVSIPYHETAIRFAEGSATVEPGVSGLAVDETALMASVASALSSDGTVSVSLLTSQPTVAPARAEALLPKARALVAGDWVLNFEGVKLPVPASTFSSWLTTEAVGGELVITLKDEVAKLGIESLAKSLTKEPTSPALKLQGEEVVVSGTGSNGFAVDASASILALEQHLAISSEREVRLVGGPVLPQVRPETLKELGLVDRIGVATTDYSGSSSSRSHNIATGAGYVTRALVAPGQEFAFGYYLGDVTAARGYREGLVIKGNRTLPEYGGGLCQVSTTVFRAALNAGLPITERHNHSYRVGFYERGVGPGLDATIYYPGKDLKWKNDTAAYIFVQSTVVGSKITYELFGTSDGRVAEVPNPTILSTTPSGTPIETFTDALYEGERQQLETAHDGARTTVTYIVRRGGEVITKQTFTSTYRNWPAQYLVGTKVRADAGGTTPPVETGSN